MKNFDSSKFLEWFIIWNGWSRWKRSGCAGNKVDDDFTDASGSRNAASRPRNGPMGPHDNKARGGHVSFLSLTSSSAVHFRQENGERAPLCLSCFVRPWNPCWERMRTDRTCQKHALVEHMPPRKDAGHPNNLEICVFLFYSHVFRLYLIVFLKHVR